MKYTVIKIKMTLCTVEECTWRMREISHGRAPLCANSTMR